MVSPSSSNHSRIPAAARSNLRAEQVSATVHPPALVDARCACRHHPPACRQRSPHPWHPSPAPSPRCDVVRCCCRHARARCEYGALRQHGWGGRDELSRQTRIPQSTNSPRCIATAPHCPLPPEPSSPSHSSPALLALPLSTHHTTHHTHALTHYTTQILHHTRACATKLQIHTQARRAWRGGR